MPAAIHTESEAVSLQTDGIHYLGVRAAKGHLVQVHVGAVGKVKFPFGFSSSPIVLDCCGSAGWDIGICHSARPVAGKIGEQVFPHIFVLRPNQAEAEQKVRKVKAGFSLISVFRITVRF